MTPLKNLEQAVRACRNDDVSGLRWLYSQYGGIVRSWVEGLFKDFGYGQDHASRLGDDALMNIFRDVWQTRHKHSWSNPESFSAWLRRRATREAVGLYSQTEGVELRSPHEIAVGLSEVMDAESRDTLNILFGRDEDDAPASGNLRETGE